MKCGAQEGSLKTCWHDDHEACKSMRQSIVGLEAVSGATSQEDHCHSGVIGVKC